MLRWFLTLLLVGLGAAAQATTLCPPVWPEWEQVQKRMISAQGRVIDVSDPREITTSEGQSYALFFALVNNDKLLFRRLVRWTENQLAQGDLNAHLPAWLWGRTPEGKWGVLDANSASDSDLWIAYTLLEAGRLWKERRYTVLGHFLLQRIAKEEVLSLPGFGAVLLPGKEGFVHPDSNRWQLNPSYVPPQLVQRAQKELPDSVWSEVLEKAPAFLMQSAPLGLAPDWVSWTDENWSFGEPEGSYDAIRVYLWIGMLSDQAPSSHQLKTHFARSLSVLDQDGLPAETVQILTGQAQDIGPVGFSAALLPLFGQTPFGQAQRERINKTDLSQLGYYNSMLLLFGTGWDEKRYAFDEQGQLVPAWKNCE